MARILMLSYLPLYPTNGGGRVRIRQLARHLSERHSVSVVCPPVDRRQADPGLDVLDCGIRGPRQLADPRLFKRILDVARDVRPDVVMLEYIWQGAHAFLLHLARRVPVVLDAFDVVTLRMRRAGHPLWLPVSMYERLVLRNADRVLAVSDLDREQLVRLGAPKTSTSIVPNGVETSVFRPDSSARNRVRALLGLSGHERLLFFFGQLDYTPNADAVRTLATHIMPRMGSEFRLAIAGRGRMHAIPRDPRITFVGAVDRIADYVNAADAVVAPVTSGSGTRLKVLESVACGTPTVTTPLGAEGIDREACAPALQIVGGGWDAFAEAARRASNAGHVAPPPTFAEMYDWKSIVGRMEVV